MNINELNVICILYIYVKYIIVMYNEEGYMEVNFL